MSWENNHNRSAENANSVDLSSSLVGQALNLMAERDKCGCPSSTSGKLPPGLDSGCINLLDSERNIPSVKIHVEVELCVAKTPGQYEPPTKYDMCVAKAPGPYDPPPKYDLCVAKAPGPYDPPPRYDLCVAKAPGPHDPPPKYDLCVAKLPIDIVITPKLPSEDQMCSLRLPLDPKPRDIEDCRCVVKMPWPNEREHPPKISEDNLCVVRTPWPGEHPPKISEDNLCVVRMPWPGEHPTKN